MQKRDVPYLVFGILITAVASCRSTTENNHPVTSEPAWMESSSVDASRPTAAPAPGATVKASSDIPLSSPIPPRDNLQGGKWQDLGSNRVGLSLVIPPTWVNLTDQINIPAMGNRLGINLIFAADSERTGRSLLAGKSFTNGAYISGLIVAQPSPTADPAMVLVELLAAAAPLAVLLTSPVPISSANGVDGITVDIGGGPIGLNVTEPDSLRTRVALFAPSSTHEEVSSTWIAVLLSATTSRWEQYAGLFDEVLQSVQVFPLRPGATAQEGNVIFRGEMQGDRVEVDAMLENDLNDLWTFTIAGNRYISFELRPQEPHLDLTLTLMGPDRRTIARVANGYNGVTESVTDLPLAQTGVYIVEVSEFHHQAGPYTLSLVLSDQPQYSGGGPIAFGQTLQSEIPVNGQQYWVFSGVAYQQISIVIDPGLQTVDSILELYGPDGQQLIALDEGFSGDPEVLSGFELPTVGEYAILVRTFSPQGGPYTISLDEGDRPVTNFYDAGELVYGDVISESLQRQEAHAWFLQGKAGDHVLIRVTPLSSNLDLDIWLLNERIERIAAADSFAAGEPETIELILNADGQYIVVVRDYNGEPGEYEVAMGAAPAATPENAGFLSYGDSILATIMPGASAAWDFIAQPGDVIDIDVRAADSLSDLVLQLQGPDGLTAVEVDDNSAGGAESIRAFVMPAAGQWRVVLHEFFGDTATYQLSLTRTVR